MAPKLFKYNVTLADGSEMPMIQAYGVQHVAAILREGGYETAGAKVQKVTRK